MDPKDLLRGVMELQTPPRMRGSNNSINTNMIHSISHSDATYAAQKALESLDDTFAYVRINAAAVNLN
jgi:hypothetical protein